jgi:hypothetical protein
MAAAAAAILLCEDDRGIPRSLPLLAALVEEDARLHAAAASQPTGSDLVRAFRRRTVPKVAIRGFLERIHVLLRSEAATRGKVSSIQSIHSIQSILLCFGCFFYLVRLVLL